MTATSEGRPARAAEPRRAAGWAGWSKPWRGVFALLLALVVGFGGWSTWAYWSDQAALTTGSFSSGQLDLRLDGTNAGELGTGFTKQTITLGAMLPGESQAYAVTITNTGNPAVTYDATVVLGSGSTMAAGTLQLRIATGTPSNTTTNQLRVGSCLTSTAIGGPTAVPAPPSAAASVFTARPLAAGASEPLCLVVSMPTTVPTTEQNKTATLVITFVATQTF